MPKTSYPRATLRRIVKAHAARRVGGDVDVLIYLTYTLFMQELVTEARIRAKQDGERGLSRRAVRRVAEGCLRGWKG
ncbi:hypothetical protein EJ07DRAFT_101605 [Lizonia empirigonia]|nr:hypothetical protein EJ07DRAFT_101605 [Lizonia empirigonia]